MRPEPVSALKQRKLEEVAHGEQALPTSWLPYLATCWTRCIAHFRPSLRDVAQVTLGKSSSKQPILRRDSQSIEPKERQLRKRETTVRSYLGYLRAPPARVAAVPQAPSPQSPSSGKSVVDVETRSRDSWKRQRGGSEFSESTGELVRPIDTARELESSESSTCHAR